METGKKIFYLSPDTGKESGNISTPGYENTKLVELAAHERLIGVSFTDDILQLERDVIA